MSLFGKDAQDQFSQLPWYWRLVVMLSSMAISAGGGYGFAAYRSAGGEFSIGILGGCLAFGLYVLAYRILLAVAQSIFVSRLANRRR